MATTPSQPVGATGAQLARDPRCEAQRLLAGRFDARVLEPSPPAVTDEWFADDPTDPAGATMPVVGPTSAADLTWDRWLGDYPEQSEWAARRWLGAWRHLARPPGTFTETRLALHRLAVYVLSPARRRVNGKIALRWTLGGFGTPFFGADEQVRVSGTQIVRQIDQTAIAMPITSLNEAAAFVLDGSPDLAWAQQFDVPTAGDLDAPLPVEADSAAWLSDWYGFATAVLEELRCEPETVDPTRVQLWVEHFDAAFECMSEPEGRRAGFGVSPGDAAIPEPYLYVVPWAFDRVPDSSLWNADAFKGAVLPFTALAGAADQRGAALDFFRERRALLAA
jgi:hypothetical protein